MSTKDYYTSELAKITKQHGTYGAKIKITDESGATNYININRTSAPVLVKWLTDYMSEVMEADDDTIKDLESTVDHWKQYM